MVRSLFHVAQTSPMRCRSQEIVSLGGAILHRETYFAPMTLIRDEEQRRGICSADLDDTYWD
jgi:hypothetical protein